MRVPAELSHDAARFGCCDITGRHVPLAGKIVSETDVILPVGHLKPGRYFLYMNNENVSAQPFILLK